MSLKSHTITDAHDASRLRIIMSVQAPITATGEIDLAIVASHDMEKLVEFYEAEDILAKMDWLNRIQASNPYRHLSDRSSYWNRCHTALKSIGKQHRHAALALFSSVIYIDHVLLQTLTEFLVRCVGDYCIDHAIAIRNDETFVFAIDHPELVDAFYDFGRPFGWSGRLDNKPQINIRTVSHLLQKLQLLQAGNDSELDDLKNIFRKKAWIIITDNALGGGSASSDIHRLVALGKQFSDSPPHIIFCTQLLSSVGRTRITNACPDADVLYGLFFGDECRVNAPACRLFAAGDIRQEVCDLCRFFARNVFSFLGQKGDQLPFQDLISEPPHFMQKTIELHREKPDHEQYMAFGWQDCGFTVITERNAPTNSIPLLWYDPQYAAAGGIMKLDGENPLNHYSPPFPRNHSRLVQTTERNSEKLQHLLADKELQTRIRE